MPRFEIEYSKRDVVIVEAGTREEAEEAVYSFMENNWYSDDFYYRYGMKSAKDENECYRHTNEIISVKELPDTALSMLLDKIRSQKQAPK